MNYMDINKAFKKATGLTIEQGVSKAIEGGYEPFKTVKTTELECSVEDKILHCNIKSVNGNIAKGFCIKQISEILLDPKYWSALGKAEGWHNFIDALNEDV